MLHLFKHVLRVKQQSCVCHQDVHSVADACAICFYLITSSVTSGADSSSLRAYIFKLFPYVSAFRYPVSIEISGIDACDTPNLKFYKKFVI